MQKSVFFGFQRTIRVCWKSVKSNSLVLKPVKVRTPTRGINKILVDFKKTREKPKEFHTKGKMTIGTFANKDYFVKAVNPEDYEKVVDYLIEYYFTDEPLSKYLQLTKSPKAVEFLKQFCTTALKENFSLMAIKENGDLAAVSCNMVLKKVQKFNFGDDPLINKISTFVLKTIDDANVFDKFSDVEEAMYIAFMSVHPDSRRKGIAKHLIDETRVLAAKNGYKLLRMDCCSLYTANAAKSMGWECLNEVRYVDYKVDDQQVFHPEVPHTSLGIYGTRIEEKITRAQPQTRVL